MKKNTYITALLMIVCALAGCGNEPTGDNPSVGSFQVTVKEHAGQGLPGFMVSTVPATITATTDATGTVRITDITPGTYEVSIRKEGYPDVSRPIVLAKEEGSLEFTFFPAVTLSIRNDSGRPLTGAIITTEPPTVERTVDSEGRAVFENLPEMQYLERDLHYGRDGKTPGEDSFPVTGCTNPQSAEHYTQRRGKRCGGR
ncbi:MAG: carboxypeptidase regulatory-like domain-containing protein [Candidatus Latescibacterota bacterium]